MVTDHNFNILTCMVPKSAGHLFIVASHLFALSRSPVYRGFSSLCAQQEQGLCVQVAIATGNCNLHTYHKNFANIDSLAHIKQMGLTYTYYAEYAILAHFILCSVQG
jgi:hypothetical protein